MGKIYSSEEVMREIEQSINDAAVHAELARGYESTGAWENEKREYLRAIYKQNRALMLMVGELGKARTLP